MSKINMTRINQELEKCQSRCKSRILTLDDINSLINQLQQKKEIILTDPVNRKYFKNMSLNYEYAVPNNYKWYAYGTKITANITKYDKITVHITREKCKHIPYGGIEKKFTPVFE